MGYPDTSKFPQTLRRSIDDDKYVYQTNILDRVLFYKDLESAKKDHEVIVDIEN